MKTTFLTLLFCISVSLIYPELPAEDAFYISKTERISFKLDNETVHPWIPGSYFQYEESTNQIIYLNKINRTLKVFDKDTRETVSTVPLMAEGPNNIGREPVAFYWVNPDSIFVYSDFNNGKISLINASGEKLNSFTPTVTKEDEHNFLEVSSIYSGLKYHKGALFVGVEQLGANLKPVKSTVFKIDIGSGVTVPMVQPNPFDKGELQRMPFDYRFSSTTIDINKLNNTLIVNYPMSEEVWVKSSNTTWKAHRAKSGFQQKEGLLKEELKVYNNKQNKYKEELMLMHRYSGFVHDPYRDTYYRICRLPIDKELYQRSRAGEKVKVYQDFTIQVFDKSFNKLGESKFQDKGVLFDKGMFIDERGLWLLCPQDKSEDEMTFQLFELNKK